MAHYAFLNDDNVVFQVIAGRDEDDLDRLPDEFESWEDYYTAKNGAVCKRTSYNTRGNTHVDGGVPFRGNYAGIGYRYDSTLDAFISPQPFPSWTLDDSTLLWTSPTPYPDDGLDYSWDEDSQVWRLTEWL